VSRAAAGLQHQPCSDFPWSLDFHQCQPGIASVAKYKETMGYDFDGGLLGRWALLKLLVLTYARIPNLLFAEMEEGSQTGTGAVIVMIFGDLTLKFIWLMDASSKKVMGLF
jgi:hypothetical protein